MAFHKKKSRKSRFCAILEPIHPPLVWENGQNDQIGDQNGNIAGNRWGVVGWSDIIKYAPPLGLRKGPIRSGKLPALPELGPISRFFGPIFGKMCIYIFLGVPNQFLTKNAFIERDPRGIQRNARAIPTPSGTGITAAQFSPFNEKPMRGKTGENSIIMVLAFFL